MSVHDHVTKKIPNQTLYMAAARLIKCRACVDKKVALFKYRVEEHCRVKKHKSKVREMLKVHEEDKVGEPVDECII